MFNFFKNIFHKNSENFEPLIEAINNLESSLEKLTDKELKDKSEALKKSAISINNLKSDDLLLEDDLDLLPEDNLELDDLLPEAFALVRESAKRTLNQRHFDAQLIGGIVLHQGKIAEMITGEGKTLAATAPAYLNAITGKGVHIITVNDYLARRDTIWMGQIYNLLGLSIGCLTHETAYLYDAEYIPENLNSQVPDNEKNNEDKERDAFGGFKIIQNFLRPVNRQEAYRADILYGTNHEFGFDFLRDNLAYYLDNQTQIKKHNYVIIDEVDSILIDEARTPLIIAAPDAKSSDYYHLFTKTVQQLQKNEDYLTDEKTKTVNISDKGIDKVEKILNIENIYSLENFQLIHYLEESLRAKALFHRDKNYVVKNGEVIIVDEFTGRMMHGRRYSGGLHQAIEAKEGVAIKQESKTFAQITIQNYFRLYQKIAGMTGTAQTSAEEFHKVYKLEVVSIPTNKPMVRKDLPDLIYKNLEVKYRAVIKEIKKEHLIGRPILVGTASIEKNEILLSLLRQANIPCEILNAKNHEKEGIIIAQAGRLGAITIATNMAGRGVDIVLGGHSPVNKSSDEYKKWQDEQNKVKELGGLHIIGTERHEARRIDNQLRGRSGRQGDEGSSQFFLSLEDDLLRIFGGEKIKSFMEKFNLPEDHPIESRLISKIINEAQNKVEGLNFDARKHLLDFDDVLNKQRTAVYSRRQKILEAQINETDNSNKSVFSEILEKIIFSVFERVKNSYLLSSDNNLPVLQYGTLQAEEDINKQEMSGEEKLKKTLIEVGILENFTENNSLLISDIENIIKNKIKNLIKDSPEQIKMKILGSLDMLWMKHLESMEALAESVRLRAYGQHDPLVEYRNEGSHLFKDLFINFEGWIFSNIFKIQINANKGANIEVNERRNNLIVNQGAYQDKSVSEKVGRNDPCPCGKKDLDTNKPIKYKKCCYPKFG